MGEAESSSSSLTNEWNSMDRLPDELLMSIVSLLSLNEAARASVLARRWRHFWIFNRVLNIDGSEMLHELDGSSLKDKRKSISEWVNRVVSLHSGETIEEFRIGFNLDNTNANDIDRWIEFALRKRVKKLELNFRSKISDWSWLQGIQYDRGERGSYNFPNVFPNGPYSLVSLSLTRVDVTGEILESFVSNCPTLEDLHIENSKGLHSFRPSGEATRLRRLAIINCHDMKRIEICSPNLVSYTISVFNIRDVHTVLKGFPSLIHLWIGVFVDFDLLQRLQGLSLSGCLSWLETLTLHTIQVDLRMGEYPILPRLKKLVLVIDVGPEFEAHRSILRLIPVIDAAPLLSEIVLKLMGVSSGNKRPPQRPAMRKKHDCLKVLEIVGFAAIAVDVDMALYVLENATSLEKVIIDGVVYAGEDLHLLKRNLLAIGDLQFELLTETFGYDTVYDAY